METDLLGKTQDSAVNQLLTAVWPTGSDQGGRHDSTGF